MRLTAITVENYRSITRAYRIPIQELTVLVGPNNEGKSNVLRALVTAMNVLTDGIIRRLIRGPKGDRIQTSFSHHRQYDWKKDYPVHLQEKKPDGQSAIVLEFALSDDELAEFRQTIKSRLTGTLPLKLSLGRSTTDVAVYKKGRGSKALSKKSHQIAAFVSERLDFEHIPAVRTAGQAQRIVASLLERELRSLERDPAYVKALDRIAELQQPILNELSDSIRDTLVKFLPNVSAVNVQIPPARRIGALRQSCEIIVDDGTATPLDYKGDGVQSLAALGIMRHASERSSAGKNLVIAIEEPESHLHPGAIHEIRDVLANLSRRHQVVVSTHNPLFVDRLHVKANVIVHQKKARPAKSIEEIRAILGVRAADNLRHAELILVVEGEDDRLSMTALLSEASQTLGQALRDRTLAIDSLGGATNLAYKLALLRASLCTCHCVLDDDEEAQKAFERARSEGLITDADVNFVTCDGMQEAEFEDLIDKAVYEPMVQSVYRVSLQSPRFRTAEKWSVRMRNVFRQQGKPWNDRIAMDVKRRVAELVAARPKGALNSARRSVFDALVTALEARLIEVETAGAS